MSGQTTTKASTENNASVWSMVKLGLILAAYAVASCAMLAIVNNFTAPVIAANQLRKAQEGMKVVFKSAESFEEVTDFEPATGSSIQIEKVYLAKAGGKTIGGVAQVSGPTYDHATILVGLGTDGIVNGVSFLENTDSPGFGLKASDPTFTLASGKTFYGQFEGKKASDGFTVGETFDAISGATITSKGVGDLIAAGSGCLASYFKGHGL